MIVGSIRQKSQYQNSLSKIIAILKNTKHEIFHEHITGHDQIDLDEMTEDEHKKFHNIIFKKIKNADLIISEASSQSWSVGYLLSHAVSNEKPIVIFYQKKVGKPNLFRSLMNSSESLFLVEYNNISDLNKLVLEYVKYASNQTDNRFNLMLSPKLSSYLNEAAKKEKISKAQFLRKLLMEHKNRS